MKPQIQAKGLHIFIIVLMLLGIVFLAVGYSIAESQGMTNLETKIIEEFERQRGVTGKAASDAEADLLLEMRKLLEAPGSSAGGSP